MKKKRMIRVLALILAAVLCVAAVVTAILSTAYAGQSDPVRNAYTITATLQEDIEALRVSQRLDYTNTTGQALTSVLFAVYANMYRRESALMYESDALLSAFPDGYAPGGLQFDAVTVNGEATDWGMQGEQELYLRVACSLEPGESCVFAFSYLLLLTQNGGFLGSGYDDWRLEGFYPLALCWENGDFVVPTPNQNSQFVCADAADYALALTLPAGYLAAAPGEISSKKNSDGSVTWTIDAANRRALSVSFSLRWRESVAHTASGTQIRLLTNRRSAGSTLNAAVKTVEIYESWFGALPGGSITLAQSDYALDFLALDGLILFNASLPESPSALERALDVSLAKQYFGYSAFFMPTEDAWLSDATCEYLHYLAVEQRDGHDAFLRRLNADLLPSIQVTIPGSLEISYDASLFTASEYDTIVRHRGALVLHQLRNAMGLENFLAALSVFHQMGAEASMLGEYDLVAALDHAGGSWEAFLTDWLFNIDQYADHTLLWID